jgi:phosphatidylglycerol---prolipoprotein diacylglyceryl transferase
MVDESSIKRKCEMIVINWNPVAHIGPLPINWYGLGWVAAFLTGAVLVRRWAWQAQIPAADVENLLMWVLVGAFAGARLYFVAQNDSWFYITHPWRIVAVWEGGLAFFGGLFGATAAAYIYTRRHGLPFGAIADLFAPAVPIATAVGRVPCLLDGMDYGTPTTLPWGVIYTNLDSYAPTDGVPRHPDQFYELLGDLVIAAVLLRLRRRVAMPDGTLFLIYLGLFSVLRFFLFFVRGNVPVVALGLNNAQWTSLAILAVAIPTFLVLSANRRHSRS